MKRIALLLALALTLMLCGCTGASDETVSLRGDSEATTLLASVLDAVICCDAEAYLACFPPEAVSDYDKYDVYGYFFSAENMRVWLERCSSVYSDTYGDNISVKGTLVSETVDDVELFGDANLDYYTYNRYVTRENTEAAYTVTVEYTVSGKTGNESKTAEVYLVKQNGVWYLHPFFIFYSFL